MVRESLVGLPPFFVVVQVFAVLKDLPDQPIVSPVRMQPPKSPKSGLSLTEEANGSLFYSSIGEPLFFVRDWCGFILAARLI